MGFQSLQEHIDTTTSSGKLIFHLFGALAEFERDLIRERTQAGLVAARTRGRVGGRPPGLSPQAEATAMAAETLYREGQLSVRQIADKLHIAKSTLYVYLPARPGVGHWAASAAGSAGQGAPAHPEDTCLLTVMGWSQGRGVRRWAMPQRMPNVQWDGRETRLRMANARMACLEGEHLWEEGG